MSKRTEVAKVMAEKSIPTRDQSFWLAMIYAFEAQGFQVVKTSETAEYHGLRNAGEVDFRARKNGNPSHDAVMEDLARRINDE